MDRVLCDCEQEYDLTPAQMSFDKMFVCTLAWPMFYQDKVFSGVPHNMDATKRSIIRRPGTEDGDLMTNVIPPQSSFTSRHTGIIFNLDVI